MGERLRKCSIVKDCEMDVVRDNTRRVTARANLGSVDILQSVDIDEFYQQGRFSLGVNIHAAQTLQRRLIKMGSF